MKVDTNWDQLGIRHSPKGIRSTKSTIEADIQQSLDNKGIPGCEQPEKRP
ncbi:hypothetical protein sscle_12g087930 [Sclerotinia sclerotiorum 1980 UF-70]|uniref:Uncharacterized protein n=1 Tax=Sclerotinia sclerotiorum (strain ATCC 18683 / 1980 / Ss-1) TaxID=665079 RepID=A0A1D9QHD2_SCLS1|nr:hypothetical protein sscle_12g087930 [Sclerotinia sclerotiorum 1980 UF-70]